MRFSEENIDIESDFFRTRKAIVLQLILKKRIDFLLVLFKHFWF